MENITEIIRFNKFLKSILINKKHILHYFAIAQQKSNN